MRRAFPALRALLAPALQNDTSVMPKSIYLPAFQPLAKTTPGPSNYSSKHPFSGAFAAQFVLGAHSVAVRRLRSLAGPALTECFCDVTRFAVAPERTTMRVICAMAGVAGGGGRYLGRPLDGVTRVALQTFVGAGQRILGFLVVIEAPERKTVGVMAPPARGPQTSFMRFIFVATLTGARRILVGLCPVALFAWYCGMQPNQREPRQIVIKGDLFAPSGFRVAGLTFAAKLTLMRVILFVTRDTCHGQLLLVEIALVAGIALDGLVFALERKFGRFAMIEVGFLPLLRRVTCFTF